MANAESKKLVVDVVARIASLERELKRANGIASKSMGDIERRGQQMTARLDGIGRSAARALIVPLSGIGAALSVAEVTRYADAWTAARNSLAVAGVVGANQAKVLERLYDAAQANAAPVGALADLYGKAAQASDNLGASQDQLLEFSGGVATALRVAGTSAGVASGALTQLGQLLGQARVSAEEFNSVNEGARPILIAVANGLDKAGGSVSKLKELVNEGEVSGRAFFEAFLEGLPVIERMAANATQTIDQGMTRVRNAFTKYIGETDASLGASQRLVAGLNALADNFDQIADTTVQVAAVLAGALTGRAIGGMVAALPAAVAGLQALVVGLRSGAVAAGLLTASMGPIGAIAGAAAAAIWLFRDSNTDAQKAADQHEASLRILSSEIDNIDYSNAEAVASTRAKIAADLDAASAALTRAQAERELAAAIVRDEIDPAFSLLPAPAPSDPEGSVADNPIVKDRQALIDTLTTQIETLRAKSAEFEDIASGRRSPPSVRPRGSAGGLPPVGAGGGGRGRSGAETEASRATKEAEREREAVKDLIAEMIFENALIGASEQERATANALRRAGAAATKEQRANIEALVKEEFRRTEAIAASEEAMTRLQNISRDVLQGMTDDMIAGASAAEVLSNALARVGQQFLQSGIDALIEGAFPGAAVGAAAPTGGLLGGRIIPGFLAEGGYTGDGGKYEPKGVVHGGEYVFSKASVQKLGVGNLEALHRATKGFAEGGHVGLLSVPTMPAAAATKPAGGPPVLNLSITVNGARGNTEIREMVAAGVSDGMRQMDHQLPARIREVNADRRFMR